MVVHRFVHRRSAHKADQVDAPWLRAAKIAGTLHFVVLSRIFFRASDIDNAFAVMRQLIEGSTQIFHVTAGVWALLALGYTAHYTPRGWFESIKQRFVTLPAPAQGAVLAAVAAGLMLIATQDVVPYIYFQF
jgi:alginate O-acetyltransferase complex protein AlgI